MDRAARVDQGAATGGECAGEKFRMGHSPYQVLIPQCDMNGAVESTEIE